MNLEHKRAALKVEASTDEGVISGYANVYGVKDFGSEIVERGAFADAEGKTLPMLWGHNQFEPAIGVWNSVREDEKGIFVEGALTLGMTRARDVFESIKSGAVSGLSIGFRTIKDEKKGDVRHIQKAELWEASVVNFPMNIESRIDSAKAASMTEREIEQMLTRDAGLSRSTALLLMKGGYSALSAKRDAGDDAANRMLNSILSKMRA